MLAQEFTSDQLPDVIKLVKLVNRGQCQVAKWEFHFDAESDTLYKLLMTKLPLELATDLRQVGSTNGVELYRRVVRRIGPPQENDAFHMGNEIRGLGGKGTLRDFSIGLLGSKAQALPPGDWCGFSSRGLSQGACLRCGRGHHWAP
jgi:hypothetical protein